MNPAYTFVGDDGVKQTVGLLKRSGFQKGLITQLTKVGLCSSRINALLNGQDYTKQDGSDIVVNPKFAINSVGSGSGSGSGSSGEVAADEPGIPELKRFHYDKYDYDQSGDKRVANNGFNAMSPAMQKVYEEDVNCSIWNSAGRRLP